MQFSPPFYHFISLRSNYPPQQPVLIHLWGHRPTWTTMNNNSQMSVSRKQLVEFVSMVS
jgi:hypothetical protein